MDEADRNALRLNFDRRLMLRFRNSVIASGGGLLAYRVERRARSEHKRRREIGGCTHRQERTAPFGWVAAPVGIRGLAGYEDVNGAECLCRDPAVRWFVGGGRRQRTPRFSGRECAP